VDKDKKRKQSYIYKSLLFEEQQSGAEGLKRWKAALKTTIGGKRESNGDRLVPGRD